MRFKEFGSKENLSIVFIHGFGISWKMWMPQIDALQKKYHLILPLLDGHDVEYPSSFTSVETSAQEIVTHLEQHYQGKVFAICGASLGATIGVHMLALKHDIAEKAIIDGAPVVPLNKLLLDVSIWYRWQQIRQIAQGGQTARNLYKHTFYPDFLVEDLFEVGAQMTRETCERANRSAFTYTLPDTLRQSQTETLYWYGSKEAIFTRKSADAITHMIPNARHEIFPGYDHGELCIGHADEYIRKAGDFFQTRKNQEK